MRFKSKKFIPMVLAFAMSVSLVSCSKAPPTADELVAGISATKSIDADLEFELTSSQQLAEIFGESGVGTVDIKVNGNLNYAGSSDLSHVSGSLSADFLGTNQTVDVDSYYVADDNNMVTTYAKDSATGKWEVTTQERDDNESVKLDAGMFSDLVLDSDLEEDCYVVTGKLDLSKAKDALGDNDLASEALLSVEDIVSDGLSPEVVMRFDKKTERLESVKMDGSVQDGGTQTDIDFSVNIEINSIDDVSIEVPVDEILG